MSLLDELGCKYGTQKASNAFKCLHNYLPFYESFLAPLRDQPITLLEIGVENGFSLLMWRDYFLRGRIIGMDCADCSALAGGRIEIVVGDQNSPADLDRIGTTYGPFDVVIDDAGHHPPSQVFCHGHMLQYVKPGGFYILEDLVGLDGPFPDQCGLDYLANLGRSVMHSHVGQIESIAFSYGTSVTRLAARPPRSGI